MTLTLTSRNPNPMQIPSRARGARARQAVAAEAVALEERLLQARSAQLLAGREAGAGREEARRAAAQASAVAADRASLQDTIDMLQARRRAPRRGPPAIALLVAYGTLRGNAAGAAPT